jgi:hypothetical protein
LGKQFNEGVDGDQAVFDFVRGIGGDEAEVGEAVETVKAAQIIQRVGWTSGICDRRAAGFIFE